MGSKSSAESDPLLTPERLLCPGGNRRKAPPGHDDGPDGATLSAALGCQKETRQIGELTES